MAISLSEVKKLAELSRIELSNEETEKMRGEIDSILSYVDAIKKVKLPDTPASSPYLDLENVMREDGEPHTAGAFTSDILAQAPRKEGRYFKVKKILGG